jgi:hypothetical protein
MAQRLSDMVAERPVVEDRKVFRLGDIAAMQPVQYDDEEANVLFSAPSESAESLIGVPEELRKSYKDRGKIGAFEAFARNAKPWTFLPFGTSAEEGVESIAIMSSLNRLQANDYKEGDGMVQRNKDVLAVNEYLRDKVEEQERGYSLGGQVVNVTKELPAVMLEFLATGPQAVGGRMVARKGAEKLLSKVMEKSVTRIVARKAAGTVGSIATRTAMLGAVKIPSGTAKRMLDDRISLTDKGVKILDQGKSKPFTSLIKATGDLAFEVASEQAGGTIRKVAGAMLSPLNKAIAPGVAKLANNKMVMAITRLTDKLKAGGLAKELADKTKFDGILEEYGEERWGNFLRAVSGVEDFGATSDGRSTVDPSFIMDRVIASVPSIEESLVELAAFSVPAGGQMALSYAENLKKRVEAEPEVSDEIITKVADEIIAQQTEVATPAEVAPMVEQTGVEKFIADNPTATAEEYVASKGTPLYHGTNAKFERFSPQESKRFGLMSETKVKSPVAFVSENGEFAGQFGKNVMEVYGGLKSQLDLSNGIPSSKSAEYFGRTPSKAELFGDKLATLAEKKGLNPNKSEELWELLDDKEIVDLIKNEGFDNVLLSEFVNPGKSTKTEKSIAILYPERLQTKSQLTAEFNAAKGKVAQKPAEDVEYDVAPIPDENIVNNEKRYLARKYGEYLGGLERGGRLIYSDYADGPTRVTGRLASERPTWWQNLGITMPRTKMIFDKVANGEELTATQQRDYDILVKNIEQNDPYVVKTLKENREYERKRMDYEQAGGTQEEVDELVGIIGEAQSAEEIGFTDQELIDATNDPTVEVPIVPQIPDPPSDQPQPEGDKPRGLSVSIEADTIKEGLVKDLGDLPTYQTRNMEEIANRVSAFINDDYELAKRIALGEAPEQDGLRAQELYTGIRIKATMEGDVDTLRDLAMSEQATAMATELGQRIKALDSGVPEDPVTAIRNLKKSRTDAVEKKVGKAKVKADIKNTVNQVKESTKKAAKKMDWAGFVASLEC